MCIWYLITQPETATEQVLGEANQSKQARRDEPVQPPLAGLPLPTDVIGQLERLAALKEKGLLTAGEFEEQKRKLLAG